MADTTAASKIPANLLTVYEDLKKHYMADAPQMEYKPQSTSALRAQLAASLRPSYDAAARQRQQQTTQNRASIDADAAARGVGSSTWVTDRKARLNSAEASDLSSLWGGYGSTLASQLLSKLSEQDSQRMSVEQYNKSQQASAAQNAWNTAMNKYQEWDPVATNNGGGYYGNPDKNDGEPDESFGNTGSTKDSVIKSTKQTTDSVIKSTKQTTGGGTGFVNTAVTDTGGSKLRGPKDIQLTRPTPPIPTSAGVLAWDKYKK